VTQQIIILYGLYFRDRLWAPTEELLKKHCDTKAGSSDTFTFPKEAAAQATYELQAKFDLADFAEALNTPGAVVVYCGHSRWGQGPCFGPPNVDELPDDKAYPVNPWGVHFRMGYDATAIKCIDELMLHSVMPTEYDLTAVKKPAFLSRGLKAAAATAQGIKPGGVCRTIGAWRAFGECQPALAVKPTTRGEFPLRFRHYYSQLFGGSLTEPNQDDFWTAVTAGSADLNKSKLPGKLLVMGSCSSHVHYFAALDRQRQAVQSTCKFMLTGLSCSANFPLEFLTQVLVNRIDPTTTDGMNKLVRRLNGVFDSGLVGLY
jgi:hypothetical protein